MEAIAAKAEISKSALYTYTAGTSFPDLKILGRIFDAIGVREANERARITFGVGAVEGMRVDLVRIADQIGADVIRLRNLMPDQPPAVQEPPAAQPGATTGTTAAGTTPAPAGTPDVKTEAEPILPNFAATDRSDEIPVENLERHLKVGPKEFRDVVGVAAGPERMHGIEPTVAIVEDNPNDFVVRVAGNSMERTLRHGELVRLAKLAGEVEIQPGYWPGYQKFIADAGRLVEDDGIYLVALNGSGEWSLTLKRLRVEEFNDGQLLMELEAENRNSDWGRRGTRVLNSKDHVRILARLVARDRRKRVKAKGK